MPEPIQIDDQGNILIKINWKRTLKVLLILLSACGAYYLPIPGLTEASKICMMIFTMFSIIGPEDLKKIEWNVLFLVAGGLTLGVAMKRTGL
jgi:di/tricarboxylate transporter